ncbi:MAG: type II secretion system protein [Acidobacteriota bacterium]
MSKMRERHQQGFSLLELIVALGILLIITAFVISAFTNGLKTLERERGLADRDSEVKRAVELMTIEIGQAGVTPEVLDADSLLGGTLIGIDLSAIGQTIIPLANAGGAAAAIRGFYPGRPLILGLPEGSAISETVKILNVNAGCTAPCVTLSASSATSLLHTAALSNLGISSPMLPNPFGILNPPPTLPMTAPFEKTVNRIGFVGDILGDGNLYYVDYRFDSSLGRIFRTMRRISDGNGRVDDVILDNVTAANFTIVYPSAAVPVPVAVRISVTAQSSVPEARIVGGSVTATTFKTVSVNTEVVPRGTAAAAVIWVNVSQNVVRSMIPPCNGTGVGTGVPPCNWSAVPWWQNVLTYAATPTALP